MIALRDFTQNDMGNLVTILNDAAVTQFLSPKIPFPYTTEDALWWVEEGSRGDLTKAISVDGQLVGCIGVTRGDYEYQKSGEIGSWIAREYWRKGIAGSAIQQITDVVFSGTDIVRLFATVFSGNIASMRLLLKSGFTQEAVLQKAIFKNGQYFDSHIFAKLRPLNNTE
ncbi:GNAT family N-acetyltransferase [Alteromonas gilva]|uniref:GNAT family protein n=1 Tax=Alteromonas gilva TaxID=2987522 RepID=A0ABT5L3P4_9ALTE|nr:GNAT family protein [Alteromonas gilva]MDC8831660.1 GNAT family protein [Alteromonas gilva]